MKQKQKEQLKDLLQIHYGFSEFRLGQEKAIDSILDGKDVVVIMPTGGGKSLIYQLPSLVLEGTTLVISPLIALMKDQVDFLNSRGIPAAFINSSLSWQEIEAIIKKVKQGGYKLLYIAPERFNSPTFLEHLKEIPVNLFAIDEAHCISEWGHDFRPSYTRLNQAINLVGNPPVAALTATATKEVKQDIIKQLKLTNPEVVVTGFARPNLQFGAISTSQSQKAMIIVDFIKSLSEIKGIIYAGTRARADEITRILLEEDVKAVSYHAGMDGEDRKWVQESFMQDKTEVVVATNAFGLGIDKKNIRFVIHHDMPGTVEAYYQEAGRAGRDGKASFCLLLHSSQDKNLQEFFIRGDNPSPSLIVEIYNNLLNHEQENILFTYSELSQSLSESVPDMAIGTSLKILEREGLISRVQEKAGNAYLKLLTPWEKAFSQIGARAKVQTEILNNLKDKFSTDLANGWNVNLDEVAEILKVKKESLKRTVRSLVEKEVLEYYPPFKGTEIKILKRLDPEEVKIDFKELEKKASQAYNKLNKIENYVYTSECRQKFILDYFGDLQAFKCHQCDNCTGFSKQKNHNQTDGKNSLKEKRSDNKIKTKLTQLETWELYQKGLTLDKIAEARGLTKKTIIEHLCFLLEKGLLPLKEVDKLVSTSKQKKIAQAIDKVGQEKLKPIKENLPEDIDYEEIKLVLAKIKKNG